MKKRYISKTGKYNSLASDLSIELDVSFVNAKSKVSRTTLGEEVHEIEIDGEVHKVTFYLTPTKWLLR